MTLAVVLKWLVALLVVFEAGWMVFDGVRALVVGDYVTPSSGPYAGQLGPWWKIAAAVGIDPRSTAMKVTFIVYGAVWLSVLVFFVAGARWAAWALLALAAGSLWYLVVGTVSSLIQIGLLLWLLTRQ